MEKVISIRAPARGATSWCPQEPKDIRISIRAPARGATEDGGHILLAESISIRAPARGATYAAVQAF